MLLSPWSRLGSTSPIRIRIIIHMEQNQPPSHASQPYHNKCFANGKLPEATTEDLGALTPSVETKHVTRESSAEHASLQSQVLLQEEGTRREKVRTPSPGFGQLTSKRVAFSPPSPPPPHRGPAATRRDKVRTPSPGFGQLTSKRVALSPPSRRQPGPRPGLCFASTDFIKAARPDGRATEPNPPLHQPTGTPPPRPAPCPHLRSSYVWASDGPKRVPPSAGAWELTALRQ